MVTLLELFFDFIFVFNVGFDANHIMERCRLFLLIALGGTVLRTDIAIAAAHITLMTLVTVAVALVGTVDLYALNFGHSRLLTLPLPKRDK